MNRSHRIKELESLRGIMALWVVVNHIIHVSGLNFEDWVAPLKYLGKGALAVDVFIILSGFVIFYLIEHSSENYRQYIIRRFFRLFPAFIVCFFLAVVTVDIALEVLETLPWRNTYLDNWILQKYQSKDYIFGHVLAHLTMLHGVVPEKVLPATDNAFLGPAWSISLEWQFYLLAPLFYFIVKQSNTLLTIFLLLVFVIVHLLLRTSSPAFLPSNLHLFFIGILTYFCWTKRDQIDIDQRYLPIISVALMLALFLFLNSVAVLIWGVTMIAIIAVYKESDGYIEKFIVGFLRLKPMMFIGKISYSLYLCHIIVLFVVAGIGLKAGLLTDPWRSFLVLSASVIPLSIALAALLFGFVERPGMNYAKQLVKGRQQATSMSSSRK